MDIPGWVQLFKNIRNINKRKLASMGKIQKYQTTNDSIEHCAMMIEIKTWVGNGLSPPCRSLVHHPFLDTLAVCTGDILFLSPSPSMHAEGRRKKHTILYQMYFPEPPLANFLLFSIRFLLDEAGARIAGAEPCYWNEVRGIALAYRIPKLAFIQLNLAVFGSLYLHFIIIISFYYYYLHHLSISCPQPEHGDYKLIILFLAGDRAFNNLLAS